MRTSTGLLLLWCGCSLAVDPGPGVSTRADAIRGGTVDADGGYPQTFMVRTKYDTGAQSLCTGTLITSRTILTAAHCFDPAAGPTGATSVTDVYVTNVSPDPGATSPLWARIDPSQCRVHPNFQASTPQDFDVALTVLPTASTVKPAPHQTRTLTSADVNAPLQVVGFGVTSFGGTDSKIRRFVTLPLKSLTAKHLGIGNGVDEGMCNGDSGGPSFLRGRDGVWRVAGIHSYDSSRPNCNDGLDTRVDLFKDFIEQFIRDREGGPSCDEDGQCAAGCPTVDVDCVCQADGSCNAQCPNLLTDPDCPADCVGNGVCAVEACPRPDPDCVAELGACTAATQCRSRLCAADPQRAKSYCTSSCPGSCPTGTECVGTACLLPQLPTATEGQACTPTGTFCLGGTACSGVAPNWLTCRKTCAADTDCEASLDCLDAENGVKVCGRIAAPGAPCDVATTRCTSGTACTALPQEPTTCQVTCSGDSACRADEHCDLAVALCRPKEVVVPAAGVETSKPATTGCGAVPGPLLWGGLALATAARRPRRGVHHPR